MTKTVSVPVAAKCAVKVERPAIPDVASAESGAENIDALARVYRAYYLLTAPYMAALEAALKGCGAE